MQLSSNGAGRALDFSSVITKVTSIAEARSLPAGSVVGDLHGGVTFSDGVAAILEERSTHGWRKLETDSGAPEWTIIVLNR